MGKRKITVATTVYKDLASLKPLAEWMGKTGRWDVRYHKVKPGDKSNAELLLVSYNEPVHRLMLTGWKGTSIYVDHGAGPLKKYGYREFLKTIDVYDLLFFPGPVFQRKMKAFWPEFDRGLLGGLPKTDELVTFKGNRKKFCKELGLDPNLPIVIFAPTWGGNHSTGLGIHNCRYLKGIPNLVICPHEGDYGKAKSYGAVVPPNLSNINPYLAMADLLVTDVSSTGPEFAQLDRPIVMIELKSHPGCAIQRDDPWKIPDLDERLCLGPSAPLAKVRQTVMGVLSGSIDPLTINRRYWAEQCLYKPDGATCRRLEKMIWHFLETGERKQL